MTHIKDVIDALITGEWAHGSITITVLQHPKDDKRDGGGSYDLYNGWDLPVAILTTDKVVAIIYDASEDMKDWTDGADVGDAEGMLELWGKTYANVDDSQNELIGIAQNYKTSNFKIKRGDIWSLNDKFYSTMKFTNLRPVAHP